MVAPEQYPTAEQGVDTKPLPLWIENHEAKANTIPEVGSALSAAADIALTPKKMRSLLPTLGFLTMLVGGCAHAPVEGQPILPVSKHVSKETDAIEVVLAEIKRKGGDPARKECSAREVEGLWRVTAWHIWYPNNKGSSRFVPGGFTIYVIGGDGKILQSLPGH